MTKRFLSALRYTVVAGMMASFFVLSGCSSDDDKGPTTFSGSIYQYITQDQFKQSVSGNADTALDSLVMYLDKPAFADVKAQLTGTTEITLFAPSNTAFKSLTALPGLADPDAVNPEIIKGVLMYHLVPGKKTSADLTAGASITTLYSPPGGTADVIKVNNDGTLLTGSSTKNIVITTADQMTTNGVVHTTKTVLIPNATGNQLAAILGSLAATVLLGKDFTYMAYFIGLADAGATDPTKTITGTLAGGSNLTLLAVPNAVFVAIAKATLKKDNPTDAEIKGMLAAGYTNTTATAVLKNHIIGKKYTVSGASGTTKFTNGVPVTETLSGKAIGVTTGVSSANCQCATGVVLAADASHPAPIVIPDVSSQAGISNGIMQVVGGIIL